MAKVSISQLRATNGIGTKPVTEERFIRKILVELYSAYDTDVDVDQVQLGPVVKEDAYFLACSTTVDLDYTVDLGYNYEKVVQEEERVYRDGGYKTEYQLKKKTLTRWEPFQGQGRVTFNHYHRLDAAPRIDVGDMKSKDMYGQSVYDNDVEAAWALREAQADYYEAPEGEKAHYPKVDEAFALREAQDYPKLYSSVFSRFENELPGDEHKNFNPKWTVNSVSAAAVAVERIKTSFEYRGQRGYAYQYATGGDVHALYHGVDEAARRNAKKDLANELENDPQKKELREKKERLLNPCMWIGIGAFFGGLLLSGLSGMLLVLGVLVAAGAGGYYLFVKKTCEMGIAARDKEINAKYAPLLKSHAADIKDQKIALLNARFAKLGWKSLTKKELEQFDEQLEMQDDMDQMILDDEEIEAELDQDDCDEEDDE